MRLAKNLITMRFSHFLGNVIGYVLYFSLLGVLGIFAPRGYFRKKHMGKREGIWEGIYLAYLIDGLLVKLYTVH